MSTEPASRKTAPGQQSLSITSEFMEGLEHYTQLKSPEKKPLFEIRAPSHHR